MHLDFDSNESWQLGLIRDLQARLKATRNLRFPLPYMDEKPRPDNSKSFLIRGERFFELLKRFFESLERYFEMLKHYFEMLKRYFKLLKRYLEMLKRYFEMFKRYFEMLKRYFEMLKRYFELLERSLNYSSVRQNCLGSLRESAEPREDSRSSWRRVKRLYSQPQAGDLLRESAWLSDIS